MEGQEGGEPAVVAPAEHIHGPDCDHDHEAEGKPVKKTALKPKQDAEAHRPEGGPAGAEPTKGSVKKATKAAKAEPEAAEKPKVKPKQEAEAHRPEGGPKGAEPTKGSVKKTPPAKK